MSEILVREELREEAEDIIVRAGEMCLPELTLTTGNNSTIVGTQYLLDMYDAFKNIVSCYCSAIQRDTALVADIAQSFYEYDSGYAGIPYADSWFPDVERCIYYTTVNYSVNSNMVVSDTWDFNKYELDLLATEIIDNMYELMLAIEDLKVSILNYTYSQNFTGQAALATKQYFNNIHYNACSALYVSAQTVLSEVSAYWLAYRDNQDFDAVNYESFFSKVELDQLVNGLNDTLTNLEDLHSEMLDQTNAVPTVTGGLYDYAALVPDDATLIELIPDAISRTQTIIDTVETNEANLASSYRVNIDSTLTEFASFVQDIITNGNRSNFAFPPQNRNELINVQEYRETFMEIEYYNETELPGVMCHGLSEAIEVDTWLACEDLAVERRNRILRRAGNVALITVGVIGLIATLGADLPVSATLIAIGIEGLTLEYYTADICEDYQEIGMLHQGIVDPEGYNYVRDGIVSMSVQEVYQRRYHRDPTQEEIQLWYERSRMAVETAHSVVVPATRVPTNSTALTYGLSYGERVVVEGGRYIITRTAHGLLISSGMSEGEYFFISVPMSYVINAGLNSQMGTNYNIADAVQYDLTNISGTNIARQANGLAGSTFLADPEIEDTNYPNVRVDQPESEYPYEAQLLGLSGGGFY